MDIREIECEDWRWMKQSRVQLQGVQHPGSTTRKFSR